MRLSFRVGANLRKLQLLTVRNMVSLYHILFIAEDFQATRRLSLEFNLIVALLLLLALKLLLVARTTPPTMLLLTMLDHFSVG